MIIERTLSIIKPDATRRNFTGAINDRFEKGGLRIIAQKRIQLSHIQAERFYEVHAGRSFYRDLVAFMSSGPVIVQVLEGENAVALNREIMGATDPANAASGTIRKDFAEFDRSKLGAWVRFRRECGAGDRILFLHDRNLSLVRAASPSEPTSAARDMLPEMRAEGLWSDPFPFLRNRFAQRVAAWSEAGLDTAALVFFPLLVVLPRGVAALVSAAGLCAAGLVLSASRIRLTPILLVATISLGCLLLWGTASALWSVNPMRGLVVAARTRRSIRRRDRARHQRRTDRGTAPPDISVARRNGARDRHGGDRTRYCRRVELACL